MLVASEKAVESSSQNTAGAKKPAAKARSRVELIKRKMTTRFKVTEQRLQILRLLADYRFLTTSQLQSKTGATTSSQKEQAYRDLRLLRKYEYVTSYAYVPERGTNSEHCWLLSLEGARLLAQQTGFKVKYNSHYQRHPSQERIRFRDYELELERQVASAGWQLITPQSYSRSRPLEVKTRQWRVVAQEITRLEALRYPGKVVEEEGPHSLIVPFRLNDYVAHTPVGKQRAVLLVLSPVKASKRFWEAKADRYRLLARELKVIGVFADEAEVETYWSILKSKNLLVTTFGRLASGLKGL